MSLTGTPTAVVFWALALSTFAAGLIWPRPDAPGPRGRVARARLRRAGMQLAVIVTTLVAVAGTLNAQYDWYSSWTDLGSSLSGGDATTAGGALPDTAGTPGTSHAPDAVPVAQADDRTLAGLAADPGPHGQYVTVTVDGPVSKVSSTVVLWLPQSYLQPASAHRTYPVVEVFHGVPGSPLEYSHDIDLGTMVAGLTASGHLGDSILVMPDATPGKVDTECVNGGAQGPAMEDWLTQDVPDWVRHHLRVANDRTSWATMGLSTGGFCSMMATMLHPDTYAAAIELGGYLAPQFDKHYRPFAPGSDAWNRYDLVKLAAAAPPPVQLWIETSTTDTLSYPQNAQLIAHATAPLTVTTDILQDAGHRMSVWVGAMPAALTWLGSTEHGFRP